jgi:glucose/arabinose dehydrogenase
MRYLGPVVLFFSIVFTLACGSSSSNQPAPSPGGGSSNPPPQPIAAKPPSVKLVQIASGFDRPVDLDAQPDGRLFVVEQRGVIKIVSNGSVNPVPFLDIQPKVALGGETGLLGLAFHPQYATNRKFYVYYSRNTPNLQAVFAEYQTSAMNPDVADPASERILFVLDQPPFGNHQGGQIASGPDGMLYIALGDGGGHGDPNNNGQNTNVLDGKILRINVDAVPFGIPPDNPFANGGGRPEIYAYGFRNPWRFSFDSSSGRLFVGDVGEDRREEIDIVTRGGNYGWSIMEGTLCFKPETGCNQSGLTLPIHDYGRDVGGTVIGGIVYRGTAIPQLNGFYVFGDFLSHKMFALREGSDGTWTRFDLISNVGPLTSFGHDAQGELYTVELGGTLSKIVAQ